MCQRIVVGAERHGTFHPIAVARPRHHARRDPERGSCSAGEREGVLTPATYDIFLSHSFADAAIVLGLKKTLEEFGFSVYVDWIEDSALDRSQVTPATAALLRERMRSCRSLLYASSPNATSSKWMPWELGYFDGYNARVAIVPVVASPQTSFVGQEYLGLYPYVDKENANDGRLHLWINSGGPTNSKTLESWLAAA